MKQWTFQTLNSADTAEEGGDKSGTQRLGELQYANRLKYISIVLGVLGVLLSAVGIIVAIVLSTGKGDAVTTLSVTQGNVTTVITTTTDAEIILPPSAPPPITGAVGVYSDGGCTWPCYATASEATAVSPTASYHDHVWVGIPAYVCHMPDGFTGALHAAAGAPCPTQAIMLSPTTPPPPGPLTPSPFAPSPPPPSPPPPETVACLASSAALTNNNVNYLLDGSSSTVNVGANSYTLSSVPSSHPVKLETSSGSCTPTIVSASGQVTSGGYYSPWYYGTIVYSLAGCADGASLFWRCRYHGVMNGGLPLLSVNAAC